MPGRDAILSGLQHTALHYWWIAGAWHVAVAATLIRLRDGWIPTNRAAALLSLPIATVGVFAVIADNPFNAAVFLALAPGLWVIARRLAPTRVEPAAPWERAAGLGLLAFGCAYPHFLETWPTLAYLVAAPLGTIPCPTLAVLCGFTLMANGFSSRIWSRLLAAAALFYGVFGVVVLGVYIDAVLIVGGLLVIATPLSLEKRMATRSGAAA